MKNRSEKQKQIRLWAVLVWLAVWQVGSMALGQEVLLVSPVSVLVRLGELVRTAGFWSSVGFSLLRIGGGCFLAIVVGVALAALAGRFTRVRELVAPLMLVIKAIPVASFVILVLVWVPSRNLSVVISFLIVLPVIYTNVVGGIRAADPQILEMARVFRLPAGRTVRYIYVSQVLPFFRTALSVGLGLCWKAGVAAEVIGLPKGSIGMKLHEAKIYLETPDVFAWTVTIVVVSYAFEKALLRCVDAGVRHMEKM
ncbi:MAG: ABC transporter permease subunit [Clostridiales Family XIII bacterium]|jgi:NitT/TauT family transport system permease protein|nr:ABC transporter permease subunit [Clostridiales Family XIII bacterium]